MKTISLYAQNPQARLISQISQSLQKGELILHPMKSGNASYQLLTTAANKQLKNLNQIPHADTDAPVRLLCQDISEIASYTTLDNAQFKAIKNADRNSQFILQAASNTPRHLLHAGHDTLTIAMTTFAPLAMLIDELQTALVVIDVHDDGDDLDIDTLKERLDKHVAICVEYADDTADVLGEVVDLSS